MPNAGDIFLVAEDTGELLLSEQDEALIAETGTVGGILHRLHRALAISLADAYDGLVQTTDHIHPDNPLFDIADARDWYRRLGLYDSGDVSLEDMILAIKRKRSFPTAPLNKQHYLFLQGQLRAAGFDVYVYENRFWDGADWVTKTPAEILGLTTSVAILGAFSLGEAELAETWASGGVTLCVNYIDETRDALFTIPATNYTGTFFIAGATIDAFADIPAARKDEFRQLLISIKRAELAAFLFVNYT